MRTFRTTPAAVYGGAVGIVVSCLVLIVSTARCDRPAAHGVGESRIIGADAAMAPPTNPRQDLQLTVTVAVTYDTTAGTYTYAYEVENEPQSGNVLDIFGIAPVGDPLSISSPAHWLGWDRFHEKLDCVVWTVAEGMGAPWPDTSKAFDFQVGPYHPQPGTTTTGFSIVTRHVPTTIDFYAQGFDTLLDAGYDSGTLPALNTLFQNGVTGTIIGPDVNVLVGVGSPNVGDLSKIELAPPVPNPTARSVTLSFYLPARSRVQLAVHDISGRRIRLLVDGERSSGLHSISWNGRGDGGQSAGPGVYFSKLKVDGKPIGERKITILK